MKTADEIEALLLEEIRRLGHTTMEQWAVGAEKRIGKEYKRVIRELLRKKKRLNWWCVFGRIEIEERIWRTATSSYERVFAPASR